MSGDGSGSFTVDSTHNIGSLPGAVEAGDLNNDGNIDLITVDLGSNNLSILLNEAGTFSPAASVPAGNTPFAASIADFDGDGKADVVAVNYSDNAISVYQGDGIGGLGIPINFAVGSEPGSIVSADFDQNGKADLAVANRASNNISVFLNACAGNSAPIISAMQASVRQGASRPASIAVISDAEDAESTLLVTVNGGSSANVNGVSIANIAVNDEGGVIANIAAVCSAADAVFTLRVTDSAGSYAEALITVTVTASNAPVITLTAPVSLFPANGKLVPLSAAQMVNNVADDCDEDLLKSVVIESVTSDEAPAKKVVDIIVSDDCRSVQLRADRNNDGDGRVYSVNLRVTDSSGNTVRVVYKASVPRRPNGEVAIEGSAVHWAAGNCGP